MMMSQLLKLPYRTQLLLLFFFASPVILMAQDITLQQYNTDRIQRQKKAMLVLGTWAASNIAVGGIAQSQTSGEAKQFHLMNAGWNVVNLAIAGFGYYGATQVDPGSLDLYSSVQEQQKLQKALLFNSGLDIGYMLGGAYLIERSKNTSSSDKRDRLSGFGKSIALQGAFLFVFDVGTYLVMSSHNDDLKPLFEGLSLSGNGVGWRMVF